jgi:tryptophan synthase beta subunit
VKRDMKGRFGMFGGMYVSEVLVHALLELEEAFERIYPTEEFQREFHGCLGIMEADLHHFTTPETSASTWGLRFTLSGRICSAEDPTNLTMP